MPNTWGSQTHQGLQSGGEGAVQALLLEGAPLEARLCERARLVMDEIPSMGIFVELPGNGQFHS